MNCSTERYSTHGERHKCSSSSGASTTTRSGRTARWDIGLRHPRLECLPQACEKSHRIWLQRRGLVTAPYRIFQSSLSSNTCTAFSSC
jgi:hypothetical protein